MDREVEAELAADDQIVEWLIIDCEREGTAKSESSCSMKSNDDSESITNTQNHYKNW